MWGVGNNFHMSRPARRRKLQPLERVSPDDLIVALRERTKLGMRFRRSDLRQGPGTLASEAVILVVVQVWQLEERSLKEGVHTAGIVKFLKREGDVFVPRMPRLKQEGVENPHVLAGITEGCRDDNRAFDVFAISGLVRLR